MEKVYDIVNAGPKHRFTVRGKDGKPFLVHNCCQHTARLILVDQLIEIDKTYPVVMSTYDEIVVLVDDDEDAVKHATQYCVDVMTREHPMFPGLPLGVEWGVGKRYGLAK